jgi:hypothetical protein
MTPDGEVCPFFHGYSQHGMTPIVPHIGLANGLRMLGARRSFADCRTFSC